METEIVNYIREAKEHGLTEQEIKQNLLNVGWDPGQVEESFSHFKLSESKRDPSHSKMEAKPQPALASSKTASPAETLPAAPAEIAQPLAAKQKQELQRPAPANSLSDDHFSSEPKPDNPVSTSGTNWKLKTAGKLAAVAAGVAALAAGAYFSYSNFYQTPESVWKKFISAPQANRVSTEFNLSFSADGLGFGASGDKTLLLLKGNVYADSSSADNPKADATITLGYQQGGNSGSRQLRLLVDGQMIYVDTSAFRDLLAAYGLNQSWIKLDTMRLTQMAEQTLGTEVWPGTEEQSGMLANKLGEFLKQRQIIRPEKILGKETIGGQETYRLQNQVDQQGLKDFLSLLVDNAYRQAEPASPTQEEMKSQAKQEIHKFVDKLQIAKFETWIGKKDHLLYKVELSLKIPGIEELVPTFSASPASLSMASPQTRDARRMADVAEIAKALEDFSLDHKGFPSSLQGTPSGLISSYMESFPQAPKPADGNCSEYYNTYWYEPSGSPETVNGLLVYPDYQMTFCLGTGESAGIARQTRDGLQTGLPCQDSPENCQAESKPETPPASGQGAELNFQAVMSGYGQTKEIMVPQESLDLMEYIQSNLFFNEPGMIIE